jgi:hypothetical protein
MPSTYTPRNRAEKQSTGEGLNVWGANLNQRTTDLFDEALDGVESVDLGAAATFDLSDATHTKNGESDTSRQRVLIFSNTHASGTAITIPSVEKWYFIRNSGSQAITLAPSGGSTATVAAGADAIVFSNGTNAYLFRQRLNELAAPNGAVSMNSQKITGLADGTDPADAVNKAQVAAMTAADVQRANEWADKTDGFVTGSENSAKSWAVGGTGDGDPAAGSAKEWATSTSAVDGGLKGARGYANDASGSASAASTSAGNAATSATNAYNSEVGASTWATSTSVVSGGFKGARGYAEDAAASKEAFDDIWVTSASEPSPTQAGMVWFDTAGNVVKVRNSANNGWLAVTGINAASETAAGVIEIADQTETNTGSDDSKALTPKKLKDYGGTLQFGYNRDVGSIDLNDLTTPGFYHGGSMTNAPTSDQYYIEVERYEYNALYVVQRLAALTGTDYTEYARFKVGGTWYPWKKVGFNSSFKAGSGATASGASVTFTSLDCDDLLVILDGISHNNGSNTTFRVDFSTDNGSTWPQGVVLTNSVSAASLLHGMFGFTGLREGFVWSTFAPLGVSANWSSPIQTSSPSMYSIKMGGKVNAVKVSPTAGSLDAGTIYASQRN